MTSKFRLVYLWVEQYKNIENVEIRFTLDYKFTKDEQKKVITLEKTKFGKLCDEGNNPLTPLDAFTAFIGQNGSGKSNLIELISFIYTTGKFPEGIVNAGKNSFCIIEQLLEGQKTFIFISPNSEEYAQQYENSTDIAFSSKVGLSTEFGKTILYHPLDDLAAGTSSNVIFNSVKIAANPFKKLINGTTNSGLATMFAQNKAQLSQLSTFKHISESPHSRYVILFSEIRHKILNDRAFSEQFRRFRNTTAYVKLYRVFIDEIDRQKVTKEQFLISYMFLITISAVQNSKKHTTVPYLDALMLCSDLFIDKLKTIQAFETDIKKYLNKESWHSLHEDLAKHFDEMSHNFELFDLEFNELNGSHIAIKLSNLEINSALDFICSDEWFDSERQARSFQGAGIPLKIDGLSSGEISVIHFLNALKKELIKFGDSCVVILDEPENSFHPEWQRSLISILLEMCRQLDITPQIIISSHSPFILSDILEGKALLLGKKVNLKKCFAANIHDMLSNSFFLKSTIGEAAKFQIAEVVKFVNNPNEESKLGGTIDKRISASQLIIDHVGDQLLNSELTKRLNKIITDNTLNSEDLASLFYKSKNNATLQHELRELSSKYNVTSERA
jgi:energy-coupling factor transporter ATP-binding protein EcfA2